ncbi:preprotein translocase [Bacillus thuringiensis]|uniref:Preprotein translocase n=1 Tax=Bacillus thuringiensis TaxID=1428 RepID=A0AAW9GVK5_BACTU|nr:preprotein translocase [Bacillus thuringiensis]MDY0855128.1 preprotein translocase [Bacillus thuringiensis]MDY4395257.1 preprotein translocase [Bacillus thuringiensis]
MTNSDMILRLLTELKIEHQELKEQLENLQLKLTALERENSNKKTIVTKQRRPSRFPTSFHEWRTYNNKN